VEPEPDAVLPQTIHDEEMSMGGAEGRVYLSPGMDE
jgi:hypothetical protein